ncbi:choice-of-anchor K domain-containing protein [Opitutus terrae]|uniref:PEP-CTERM protein-sorting domain-containing protein n=1 Tax=Opitutus terrae (strain DSM 11246 / JCM 15787 / PB90-1) TaxID=452637 RepID=B1ZU44_OPITP|nr:choice-of-anchor K domain-containing protein [Opitutus terrae]ACB76610.1 hypothetical protein Oter_3332 [Opitutus terrae PB90-1]
MKSLVRSLLLLPTTALVCLTAAHAQLTLTGSSHGVFTGPTGLFNSITNGPVESSFTTGWPFPTKITFTGDTFAAVGNGDTFDLGQVKIKNGITLFGTAAADAQMDLYLDVPGHAVSDFKLTTLLFAITNTPNIPNWQPDLYYIGYTAPALLNIDGTYVTFDIGFTDPDFNVPPGEPVSEKHKDKVGLYATVAFSDPVITPVPEASTYAVFAALGLLGFVAIRRSRTRPLAA